MACQEIAERSGKSAELVPYVAGLVTAWRSRYQSGAAPSPRSGLADPLSVREGAHRSSAPFLAVATSGAPDDSPHWVSEIARASAVGSVE